MDEIERIVIRINELGLAMGVCDGLLIIEGDLQLLNANEREAINRLKPELVTHLTAPREHVAIMCKHRQPDGSACGDIITVERPTGKLAWCQTCYPRQKVTENETAQQKNITADKPCHCCNHSDWWISIHGQRICRVCHPPAYPELECTDGAKDICPHFARSAEQPVNAEEDAVVPNVAHVVLPLRSPGSSRGHGKPAMYVASDLTHWITDEPHMWADSVTIDGKDFVRLTPEVIAWLKEQIAKAEVACASGKLSLEEFSGIVQAFCPVYAFAVREGMVPDFVRPVRIESEAEA